MSHHTMGRCYITELNVYYKGQFVITSESGFMGKQYIVSVVLGLVFSSFQVHSPL